MSDFRNEFKKITGGDCKITAIHDVENMSDFEVKMFNPRYVDWLERRLANEHIGKRKLEFGGVSENAL